MGWSFAYDTHHDKKACVAKLTGPGTYSPGYTGLDHRVVGNHLWSLVRHPKGYTFINLFLLAGGGHQGMGWGYKGMGEAMGPYYFDCPLSLLNQADEPTDPDAIAWRQKVRAYHAAKKAKPKLKLAAGLVINYGSGYYQLVEPCAPRRGWRVTHLLSGSTFRMSFKQLANSTL